jgi:hypothetical protein
MDSKDWISALGLAQQNPVLIVAAVSIFIAGCGVAWWLRGATIEALKQRLELAREQLADVKSQLADAETTVAAQKREIANHLNAGVVVQADPLVQSNIAIKRALSSVAASTTALDETLSVPNVVRALSKPSATRRSD